MKASKQHIILGLLALSSGSVLAAGFQLQEQSVTSLGAAFAGTAAISENANSNFYNVASLTHTRNMNYSVGAFGIVTSGPVDIHSATSTTGGAVTGDMIDYPGTNAFVPSIGIARRINDNVFVGFNVASPFGLKTSYDETRPMRYVATRSEIRSFDLTPSIAYRYNEWSVGLGYNYTFVRAHLDGSLTAGGAHQPDDGFLKFSGDDWVSSMKVGVLYDMTEATRFGLQYRSKMHVKIGDGESSKVLLGVPSSSSFNAEIALPEMVTFSMVHGFAPCWTLLADISWVDWTGFDRLTIKQVDAPTLTMAEQWHPATRGALGLEHRYSDKWTFRFGAAYDGSPVPEATRTARIPDNDRVWLAMGTTYHMNKHFSVDAGYAHLAIRKASFTSANIEGGNAIAEADARGRGDIVGLQVNMNY